MDDTGPRAAGGEAYIAGVLTGADDGARARLFFELLAEIVEAAGLRARRPHVPLAAETGGGAELAPRAAYELDRDRVARSRLVVAYAGVPSVSVGIEVELAREHGVPVIVLVERERAVSRLLAGSPAVATVVRFGDLEGLRRGLADAIAAVTASGTAARANGDDAVVRRFLATLGGARQLPEAEVAALLRLAELDGEIAEAVRRAIREGLLFGAGLRDLVGRHALRGTELAAFLLRDVLERSPAESARLVGIEQRALRRALAGARERVGLEPDARASRVGQWLVTELIAPPTRALQLRLFQTGINEEIVRREQGTA